MLSMRRPSKQQPEKRQEHQQQHQQQDEAPTDYFDLNVLKGAVSFNTKPFKHRALVWIGFKKVLLFPFCWNWWLARIPRVQFFLGCTLYVLHNACAWLYVRGCLPPPRSRSPLPLTLSPWAGASMGDNHVTHVEILLPYVIGCLFGIGYGSVVAAGGWEALRVPSTHGSTTSSDAGSGPERRRGDGGSDSSAAGGGSGGKGGDDGKRDISFAAQVCAWDNRAEEEAARADGDEDDEDDDLDSSGPSSDNDDGLDMDDHRGATATAAGGGERSTAAAPSASCAAAAATATTRGPARMTRSQARLVGFKDGDAAGAPWSAREGDGSDAAGSGSEPMPDVDALHSGGGSGGESGQGGADTAAAFVTAGPHEVQNGDGGSDSGSGGGGEHLRRLSLVHHSSSYDGAEADDEEDDEENDFGWGQQVVVKPVKVSRWDNQGLLRSKALLSLNQLRACIIERAESTPQKAAYRRAARVGVFATACLPVLFTLCTILASSWINADPAAESDTTMPDGTQACASSSLQSDDPDGLGEGGLNCGVDGTTADGAGEGGCYAGDTGATCRRLRLEELASEALYRAARALWGLVSRVLKPEVGDLPAAAVSVISLCSVVFFAVPTFLALEDAERTYQRRYMYSKYFCALTSSQRARKHRLPHFSLKNVANIRVWLALRAGKTWLRRHRRERKADAVVSSAFFLSLALLAAILSEAISREARFLSTVVHWELLVWCCFISFFLLRYLTLGSNTNNRYRDTSVLLTEQINVQLRILQNSYNKEPSKKVTKRERLGVSINVLKLATKLLKELDGPNKLSGLSMNPVLYNVTRVVLVSALSGVMSDTLGFSVKLWKVISFK
eukprot:g13637.t1